MWSELLNFWVISRNRLIAHAKTHISRDSNAVFSLHSDYSRPIICSNTLERIDPKGQRQLTIIKQ